MPRSTKHSPKQTILPAPKQPAVYTSSPSMLDTMKQGFSFGIGSSIAHNMMNSIFRPTTKETKLPTDNMHELYNKCLEKNDNTINCNIFLEKAL